MAALTPLAKIPQEVAASHSPDNHHQAMLPTLRPTCKAMECLFLWKGMNSPPLSIIDSPVIAHIQAIASQASLPDTGNYGAGLRKYHLFCNIFSIPEKNRLPASFATLHSFMLWVASDPEIVGQSPMPDTPLEPVSVSTARKYLAAIRAWHIAQGWPPPLAEDQMSQINWSLRGLENLNYKEHGTDGPYTRR